MFVIAWAPWGNLHKHREDMQMQLRGTNEENIAENEHELTKSSNWTQKSMFPNVTEKGIRVLLLHRFLYKLKCFCNHMSRPLLASKNNAMKWPLFRHRGYIHLWLWQLIIFKELSHTKFNKRNRNIPWYKQQWSVSLNLSSSYTYNTHLAIFRPQRFLCD